MLPDSSESTELPYHAQLHHAGHFLAKTYAAGAVDAARHLFHRDQRTGALVEHHPFFLVVARRGFTVAHGQILQLAFAALVADRAIERVIDQQEFHHGLLGLDGLVRFGLHDHAGRNGRGTGRNGLGHLLDFDQAHTAVGRDREFLVIAEVGDVGVGRLRGLDHHTALGDFDFLAVYF
jgi:hypothetical protein